MLKTRFIAAGVAALGVIAISTAVWSQPPAGGRAGGAAPAGAPQGGGRGAPAPVTATGTPGAVIKLRDGPVQGMVDHGTVTYLGIPFAAPPVGDLRWRSPKAPAKWTETKVASKASPGCDQNEDCLYINVYTPEGVKPGAKLPVMVWIYGGAYTGGNATGAFGAQHDGRNFAQKDVITVTFNYRLGRWGWFAHPALTKQGETANFGLADQIAALKWVKANIATLGGNPNNVTAFGESAGGISILQLMVSPPAKGLFQKAIVESGFPRATATPLKVAEDWAVAAATKAGVTGDSAATADALRKLPASAWPAGQGTNDPTRPYPVLDGKTLTVDITPGFEAGKQMKIPLVIGGNSNEASFFRPPVTDWAKQTDRRPQLVAAYQSSGQSDIQAINDLVTTQRMTEPNRNLARIHSKQGNPTYVYYFSYLPPAQRATSLGVGHVFEIPYVFNIIRNAGAEDSATGAAVNAYWASFAKYGNPGAAGGVAWPKFDAKTDPVLDFSNTGPVAREHFQQAKADYVEQGIK